MNYYKDRDADEPNLTELVKFSLDNLALDKKGFFLMVEGGRIDHAAHSHDASSVIADLREFDKAAGYVQKWLKKNKNTLFIVTSDHDCGGMAISELTDIKGLKKVKMSSDMLAKKMQSSKNPRGLFIKQTYIENIAADKIETILNTPGVYGMGMAAGSLISEYYGVSFFNNEFQNKHHETSGHDGTDVILAASGIGAGNFIKAKDNTDIVKIIRQLIKNK